MEVQHRFAEALRGGTLPPGLAGPPEAAASRFAVYRNNVAVGLLRALAARFPVTEAVVGPEFFRQMARAHIALHPPQSPVLQDWGQDFPAHIPDLCDLAWLPDLARLEACWTRAYHAADAIALTLQDLASLDDLENRTLRPSPALQIIESLWPIGTIWAAHSGGPKVTEAKGAEVVVITRPGLTVQVHLLPPEDLPFLTALCRGDSLGQAAPLTADFGRALTGLVAMGCFAKEPR